MYRYAWPAVARLGAYYPYVFWVALTFTWLTHAIADIVTAAGRDHRITSAVRSRPSGRQCQIGQCQTEFLVGK